MAKFSTEDKKDKNHTGALCKRLLNNSALVKHVHFHHTIGHLVTAQKVPLKIRQNRRDYIFILGAVRHAAGNPMRRERKNT